MTSAMEEPTSGGAPFGDTPAKIFAGAMDVAQRIGWRRAALADIAAAAGISLAELHALYNDKAAILRGLVGHVDQKVLDGLPQAADGDAGKRDRLFDVLMARFDALQPYRAGLAVIVREGGGIGIADAVCNAQRMLKSFAWMLEAAGVGSGGFAGALRVKGLAVVYAATFSTWLKDDSEDMGKTMAALDRNLQRAERFASGFGNWRRGPQRSSGPQQGDGEGAAGDGPIRGHGPAGAPA